MNITAILAVVQEAERLLNTETGRAVLQFLRDRFAADLTPEQLAQLQANEERLTAIIDESRAQAGQS